MKPSLLLAIAAGGALGAVGRFLVMTLAGHVLHHGFPYGTLIVNIVGSFLMGMLVEVMALHWSPSPELRALLVVGFLGAFTTFSTFSLDVVTLAERQDWNRLGLYMAASVMLSVGALLLGLRAGRVLVRLAVE